MFDPVSGYMILGSSKISGYRGVDRLRFEPCLEENEIDETVSFERGDSRIWPHIRSGWKREAYRIFEEDRVESSTDLLLIRDYDVAFRLRRMVEQHIPGSEVLFCKVESLDAAEVSSQGRFIGYDIAYPGGDMYSAVLNGLLFNPHPSLVAQFIECINEHCLFIDINMAIAYITSFRMLVKSEASANFVLYTMIDPE